MVTSDQAPIDFYTHQRTHIDEQAAKGDGSKISTTFQGLLSHITGQFGTADHSTTEIGRTLSLLWYILIQGAKNLTPDCHEQYRMINSLLSARELGVLTRTVTNKTTGAVTKDTADCGDGKMWSDFPFMKQELERAWRSNETSMTTAERQNFAAFLAKMLAVGICGDDLAGFALSSFAVLESDAPPLPLEYFIPEIYAWIEYAGENLVLLSDKSFKVLMDNNAGVTISAPTSDFTYDGFSPSRWLSWEKRLKDRAFGGDENIAKLAIEAFLSMDSRIWQVECAMRPATNDDGTASRGIAIHVLEPFSQKWPTLAKPE